MNCKKHLGIPLGKEKISGKKIKAHADKNKGCQLPGICIGFLGSHCTGCGNRV